MKPLVENTIKELFDYFNDGVNCTNCKFVKECDSTGEPLCDTITSIYEAGDGN